MARAWLPQVSLVRVNEWSLHSLRTAVAAVLSLGAARLFRLPEAYWAAVTTLVVMQSTLGAAWSISTKRWIGTALGAALGALLGNSIGGGLVMFGLGILALGLICGILHLDRSAYRFAGITFAIVALVARGLEPAVVAAHRFVEVSIGIAVALLLTAVWPGREPSGATR